MYDKEITLPMRELHDLFSQTITLPSGDASNATVNNQISQF